MKLLLTGNHRWILGDENIAACAQKAIKMVVTGTSRVPDEHIKKALDFLPDGSDVHSWDSVLVEESIEDGLLRVLFITDISTGERQFYRFTKEAAQRISEWRLRHDCPVTELWFNLSAADLCSECRGTGDAPTKDRHGEFRNCSHCNGSGKKV
jgi:hypothetical protein